ncbi:MAG: replication initiation factor domain-containing protein [Dyella sp.]|nr:replication initiation factor domain-containing protein [Dyella sp.]
MSEHSKQETQGAADRPLHPQDAAANAAQSSRVVIRDKRHPIPPSDTPTAPAFPDRATERMELVTFQSGRLDYRLHPLPDEAAPSQAAHVDWLGFSFVPPPGKALEWVFQEVARLTTLAVTEIRTAGWNGYMQSARLGDFGIVAWGGRHQRSTIHVEINGTGCARIQNWRGLAAWGNALDAKISRIDLAHDDFEGRVCNIEQVLAWYHANGFNCGGRNGKLKHAGDWTDGTDGRTLYIGTRAHKLLRCYEKGKQLGHPDSPWCRVELELRGKNRVIPWETLDVPGQYLAGAYPCLAFLSAVQSKIKMCQKAAAMTVDVMTDNASRLSGKAINVLMQLHDEDAAMVVEKLRRDGIPKRLVPYSIGLPGAGDQDADA